MPDTAWNVVAALFGGLATVVGALIVLYLKSIKQSLCSFGARIDKQDDRIDHNLNQINKLGTRMSTWQMEAGQSLVSKEDWVRGEGYSRREIKSLADSMTRIEGKLEIVQKLPEICGQIAHQVAVTMKSQN